MNGYPKMLINKKMEWYYKNTCQDRYSSHSIDYKIKDVLYDLNNKQINYFYDNTLKKHISYFLENIMEEIITSEDSEELENTTYVPTLATSPKKQPQRDPKDVFDTLYNTAQVKYICY